MKVEQVYEIANTMTKEVLGEEAVVNEDLSNIVDLGKQFENLDNAYDNYVRKLHDHIGKMVFVNRRYTGRAPSVVMDGWEYGSILEKIRAKMPEATENESWNLQDGASYDPNVFTAPDVAAKFYNKRVTFEIPISTTERQVKSSFSSAAQLNGFYSMIETGLQNSLTIKTDELIMRTINNAIAETIYSEFPGGSYSGGSGIKAVNLLYLYNQAYSKSLTQAACLRDPDFIRFSTQVIADYMDRLKVISTLFNIGGTEKFTSADRLHVVMYSPFRRASEIYLQSDTFHNDLVKLPGAESVIYWQGSGTSYAFEDATNINVKTSGNHTVDIDGVLCTMFDRDALGVSNVSRRVTTNYNPKAEFWNEWHKFDAGYFNDLDENCVVFFAK